MLHIVTALACEAKPLIKLYKLDSRESKNGFRLYENPQIRLIISGVGQYAAAAACAYLQGCDPNHKHAWLNLGIAGHKSLPVGEAVLINKVTDGNSGQSWYPAMPFTAPCQTGALLSLEQANNDYDCDNLYDMEAAGFYATAVRFNSCELIQILKIISDNLNNSTEQVSANLVEEIISAQLDSINQLVQSLIALNILQQRQNPPIIEPFLQQWHFTATQQHQLRRLLQRWQARSNIKIDHTQFKEIKNSKALLQTIAESINKLPLRFSKK